MEKCIKRDTNNNSMAVINHSKGINRRVDTRLDLALPMTLFDRNSEPEEFSNDCSGLPLSEINESKTRLRILKSKKLIFLIAYNRLKRTCVTVRDWFEDRDSNNYLVDTHVYDTKILLIKSLRNQ